MIKLYKNEWVYQFSDSRATISVYTTEDNQPEPYPEHLTDLKSHIVEQGYFLTAEELEQFAREVWKSARFRDPGSSARWPLIAQICSKRGQLMKMLHRH